MTATEPYAYGRALRDRDEAIVRLFGETDSDPIDQVLRGYYGRPSKKRSVPFFHFKTRAWRPKAPSVSPFESGVDEDSGRSSGSTLAPARPRSVVRKIARWAVAATALPMLLAGSVIAGSLAAPLATERVVGTIISHLTPASWTAALGKNVACAERKPVMDSTGEVVGWARIAPACEDTSASYRTVPVTTPAALRIAEALEALEGEIEGPLVLLNVNFRGLARAAWYGAQGVRVGGSNAVQSSIEIASGHPNALSLPEKVLYLLAVGPHFTSHNLLSFEAKARFVANNTHCARGGKGGGFGAPIAGSLCALLFGKDTADQLSDGEVCIWAAMAYLPIAVPSPTMGRSDIQGYAAAFSKLKDRAKTCATRLAAGNAARQAELSAQIDSVPLPNPATLRDIDARLSRYFPGAIAFLRDEGVVGAAGPGKVTLDREIQKRLVQDYRDFSDHIAPRLNGRLCVSGCADDRTADVALVVAELTDSRFAIRGVVESRSRLLHGPALGRTHRSLGSAAKGLFVPLLVEEGVTRLCREAWAELQDANGHHGGDCRAPSDWLSVEGALARSSNLAFAWGLRKISTDRLRGHLRALGFDFDNDMSDAALIRSAVTGERVTTSPLNLLHAYGALSSFPTVMQAPTAKYDSAGDSQSGLMFPGRESDVVRSRRLLAAPISSPNGTARAAQAVLSRAGCKVIAAKTGTSDSTVPGKFRDKVVVIVADCHGKRLAALAMVGSPQVTIPVGALRSRELVVLAAEAIVSAGGRR